ncbi:hypothetical protein BVER_02285c [Candidatus Burkholderia verschuerenii]|uniref:DUF304 domain-containing protein n=1 Tax=Candidatus Burkholderia verschuerenii TaxID=242163 RepID=A0A0L0M341_9BURK|nr:PH domain-containing protein [Candidatus Burkholderia verschuerenii]KND56803.1 hypothetical protein BVER_02285c [Candidatus Burkholderia verschuerenii]
MCCSTTSRPQIINRPNLLGGILALIVLEIVYSFASQRWCLPPAIAFLPVVLIGLRFGIAYLRTAFTEVIIDAERITRRSGILNRTVSSPDLFRIRDMTSLHPWWPPLGIGTVGVMTSDSNNPVWFLPGIANAEEAQRPEPGRARAARSEGNPRSQHGSRLSTQTGRWHDVRIRTHF